MPDVYERALSVIEARTVVPRSPEWRAELLGAFAVLRNAITDGQSGTIHEAVPHSNGDAV
jgi:hypothetical protein